MTFFRALSHTLLSKDLQDIQALLREIHPTPGRNPAGRLRITAGKQDRQLVGLQGPARRRDTLRPPAGILTALRLLLQKTKTPPLNGSLPSASRQTRARPSMPLRKSVGAAATRIRIWGVTWIMPPRPATRAPDRSTPVGGRLGYASARWRRRPRPTRSCIPPSRAPSPQAEAR